MLWGPRVRITYFLLGGLLSCCDASDHYTIFYNISPFGSFWTVCGHVWKYTGTAHGNQCPTFFVPFYSMVPVTFQRARLRVGIGI